MPEYWKLPFRENQDSGTFYAVSVSSILCGIMTETWMMSFA